MISMWCMYKVIYNLTFESLLFLLLYYYSIANDFSFPFLIAKHVEEIFFKFYNISCWIFSTFYTFFLYFFSDFDTCSFLSPIERIKLTIHLFLNPIITWSFYFLFIKKHFLYIQHSCHHRCPLYNYLSKIFSILINT